MESRNRRTHGLDLWHLKPTVGGHSRCREHHRAARAGQQVLHSSASLHAGAPPVLGRPQQGRPD